MEDLSDVRDLKASLRSLHGFPKCMQQLMHNGNILHNRTKIDVPIDLHLVLLQLSTEELRLEAAKELAEACCHGYLTTTRLLLEAGANKNAEDQHGIPALVLAVENGHVEISWLLLEARANIGVRPRIRNTAVMLAAENGHMKMSRLLLAARADKDGCFRNGKTALVLAVENGHVEMTQLLLEAGANRDERSCNGQTALMLAAENGHVEMARLLLEELVLKSTGLAEARQPSWSQLRSVTWRWRAAAVGTWCQQER